MEIFAALLLGFVTSFHCAGMCGPIAIALPLKSDTWFSRIFSSSLYNLGRSITYAIIGFLFGFLGQGLVLIGFQRWVGIVMGSIMILSAFFPVLFKSSFNLDKTMFSFVGKLKKSLGLLFGKRSYSSLFAIGLLNGLLPCGPVYIALAASVGTGSALNGALFMFLFGIATIPILMAISLLGNLISINLRKKISRYIPVAVFIIGVLFVLRGLSLGIPFLSPPEEKIKKLEEKAKTEMQADNKIKTSKPQEESPCCH